MNLRKHPTQSVAISMALFCAFTSPVVFASAEGEESAYQKHIEYLQQENAQMKEMLMQMQKQLQDLAIRTNAMEQQAKQDKAAAASKKGVVKARKENLTIATTGGGIKVKSDNGNQFKISGRLQFDHDSYDSFWNKADGSEGSAEENEIRRSRITLSGNSGKNWSYKFAMDVDHEGEGASVDTGFLKYSSKPMYVKVGKFKRPPMLEERTSDKWTATIERSIVNELSGAVVGKPSFGGVEIGYASKGDLPMSGAFGVYDAEVDEEDGSDVYGVGGRLSIMPKLDEDSFMHLGASGYSVDYKGENHRMRSRMGVHTAGRPFETQQMKSDDIDQLGVELAYVRGPFSLQAEYMNVESDGTDNAKCADVEEDTDGEGKTIYATADTCDLEMDGFYLQAAYTLTGETRGYKAGSGAFAAIKPKDEGGAWELVARYEDAEVDVPGRGLSSELTRWVLGVNWYVNKNVKFMLNYVDSETDKCYGAPMMDDADPFMHKVCGNGMRKDDGNALSLRGQYVF